MTKHQAQDISNVLQVLISKYHLTCAVRPRNQIVPIIPPEIEELLPPLEPYMQEGEGDMVTDVRDKDQVITLRLAIFLH